MNCPKPVIFPKNVLAPNTANQSRAVRQSQIIQQGRCQPIRVVETQDTGPPGEIGPAGQEGAPGTNGAKGDKGDTGTFQPLVPNPEGTYQYATVTVNENGQVTNAVDNLNNINTLEGSTIRIIYNVQKQNIILNSQTESVANTWTNTISVGMLEPGTYMVSGVVKFQGTVVNNVVTSNIRGGKITINNGGNNNHTNGNMNYLNLTLPVSEYFVIDTSTMLSIMSYAEVDPNADTSPTYSIYIQIYKFSQQFVSPI